MIFESYRELVYYLFFSLLSVSMYIYIYIYMYIETESKQRARMSVLDTEVDGSNPGSSMLFP